MPNTAFFICIKEKARQKTDRQIIYLRLVKIKKQKKKINLFKILTVFNTVYNYRLNYQIKSNTNNNSESLI